MLGHLAGRLPEALGTAGVFLCLLEYVTENDSSLRQRADWLYRAFRSRWLRRVPYRLLGRLRRTTFARNRLEARKKELALVLAVDGLILIPLHLYRTLPHPSPTWEFALSPSGYYFAAVVLIISFLWAGARMLDHQGGSIELIAVWGFVLLANNVLMMNVRFLFAPKTDLLGGVFQEANALLYLDLMIGERRALIIVMAIITVSSYLLSYFVVGFFSMWLPEVFAAGVSRHVAACTGALGAFQTICPAVGAGTVVLLPGSLKFYYLCVGLVATLSFCLVFALRILTRRTFLATTLLCVLPLLAFQIFSFMTSSLGEWRLPVFLLISCGMIGPYLLALLAGLSATSIRISSLIFGSKKASERPFGTLGTFLCLFAGIASLF